MGRLCGWHGWNTVVVLGKKPIAGIGIVDVERHPVGGVRFLQRALRLDRPRFAWRDSVRGWYPNLLVKEKDSGEEHRLNPAERTALAMRSIACYIQNSSRRRYTERRTGSPSLSDAMADEEKAVLAGRPGQRDWRKVKKLNVLPSSDSERPLETGPLQRPRFFHNSVVLAVPIAFWNERLDSRGQGHPWGPMRFEPHRCLGHSRFLLGFLEHAIQRKRLRMERIERYQFRRHV